MSRHVVVIGAGIAGVAAAWAARRAGKQVTVVMGPAGASALGSGAVDAIPWERINRAAWIFGEEPKAMALAAEVTELSAALDLWELPESRFARLATGAGRTRPARGHDRALLDLAPLRNTRVLLPRCDRAGWDADSLAHALADDPISRNLGLSFLAADVPILRLDGEQRISNGDLAARHDDPRRLEWLAARLRESVSRNENVGAVLLGPWLGADRSRAAALSQAVGVPVGEILVGAGSPAGLRFEAARDRLLAAIGAQVHVGRVASVEVATYAEVTFEGQSKTLTADAVVLALGGLVAGGIVYNPPSASPGDDLAPHGSVPFTLSLRASVALAAQSSVSSSHLARTSVSVTSSASGLEMDTTAWPNQGRLGALESVGIRCEGVRAGVGLLAAGDVLAGRARTVIEAVSSGVQAGREA